MHTKPLQLATHEAINLQYSAFCCTDQHVQLAYEPLNDKAFIKWLKEFYKNNDTELISEEMISEVAELLFDGIQSGYGKLLSEVDYDTPDHQMLTALRENVYTFSAFKNYNQLLEVSSLLLDEDGKIRPFADFQAEASKIDQVYNSVYLKTEYQNALAQAQMASRWQEVQENKDILKMLTIRTVGDSNVRPKHAALEGLTLPADHEYWVSHWPPFDWACRCDVVSSEDKAATPDKKIRYPDGPASFKGNIGIDKKAFKDHPYEADLPDGMHKKLEDLGKKLSKDGTD